MESLPVARVVTFYGNIAEAALAAGLDAEYCIYAVARTLQRSTGANGVSKDELMVELRRLGMFKSGAHVRKILRLGSAFWTVKAGRVWLHGTADLAWAMGCRGANSHRHAVSTKNLGTREARRAQLLGAVLPIGKPIRQLAIRKHTGVSERTQRRYRAKGYFVARRQDADVTQAFDLPTAALRRAAAYQERHHGVYLVGPDQLLRKRLPNVYFPAGERIPRGQRSKEIFAAQPLTTVAVGALTVPRVFFETVPQWVRCRRLKLGIPSAEKVAYPFNVSYVHTALNRWEAVAC